MFSAECLMELFKSLFFFVVNTNIVRMSRRKRRLEGEFLIYSRESQ
jgi:hypothetical protein